MNFWGEGTQTFSLWYLFHVSTLCQSLHPGYADWPCWVSCPSLNPRDVHYTLPWKHGVYSSSEEKSEGYFQKRMSVLDQEKQQPCLEITSVSKIHWLHIDIWYVHLSHQTINLKVDLPLVGGHMCQTLEVIMGRDEGGLLKDDPKIKRSKLKGQIPNLQSKDISR